MPELRGRDPYLGTGAKRTVQVEGETPPSEVNAIPYMTKDYPAAFLLGSEYRNDMNSMAEKLETVGAHYVLVDPFAENGIAQPHCFVAAERVDPVAAEAFKNLTGFLKERILYKEH